MPTALIIGGGIAGPAAALALQRAGIDPIVFEAHPRTFTDIGSYFTVTPNGLSVLHTLNTLHLATAVGVPTSANLLWNDRGQRLASIPLGNPLAEGTLSQTIKRSCLARILQDEAIRRGVRIEFGKRLAAALENGAGQVTAHFEDGSQVVGDLLVGADGIHSRTRTLIDPAAPKPRYVGLANFGGYTPRVTLDAQPGAWHMLFGRRAFFGYLLDPAGGAIWFANVPRDAISPEERAATTPESWRHELVDLFAGDAGPAVQLIQRGELDLAGDNTYDLGHVRTWRTPRMIIIGDAAHAPSPSSGQGASMALEDALLLAKCIRDVSPISDALGTYEALRRDRVERIVTQGARSSSSKVPGPLGRIARDLLLKLLFRFAVTEKSLASMYDFRIDWQTPVERATSLGKGRPAPL
jgi:2-polyprenyl-6-methoxyphenol hydroxylase-like FAD-dependent oxidoreductase